MIILTFLIIMFGVISGISEGMVMIMPGDKMHSGRTYQLYPVHVMYQQAGIREHKWFRWYHVVDMAAYLLCAVLAIALWTLTPHWLTLTGLAFLLWECREIGYNFSRYNTVLAKSENVYGVGVEITGYGVVIAHGVRCLLSLVFLYGGVR